MKQLFAVSFVLAATVGSASDLLQRGAIHYGVEEKAVVVPAYINPGGAPVVISVPSALSDMPDEIERLELHNLRSGGRLQNGVVRRISPVVLMGDRSAARQQRRGSRNTAVARVIVDQAHAVRFHLTASSDVSGYLIDSRGEAQEFRLATGKGWTPSVRDSDITIALDAGAGAPAPRVELIEIAEIFRLDAAGRIITDQVGALDHTFNPACMVVGDCAGTAQWRTIEEYRTAVALLTYIDTGSSYICSGALVNDEVTGSFIPYMLTANHCIASSAVASTVEAQFDYRVQQCGSTALRYGPKVNGATLLTTSSAMDMTFLRLASSPPTSSNGRWYMGWDARTTTVAPGTQLYRLSHAAGLPQMYSYSIVTTPTATCGLPVANYVFSRATVGATHHGSSGGPVMTNDGSIVGQLLGVCPRTTDDCNFGSYLVVDGAFSATFPLISQWLRPGTTTTCTPNTTTACVLGGRFQVRVRYRTAFDNNAANGDAVVKSVTGFGSSAFETVFFYFNSPDNIEMMVKFLDQGNTDSQGRPTIAVLYGTATPLRVELNIFDTKTGVTKSYTSDFPKMQGGTDFTAFVK